MQQSTNLQTNKNNQKIKITAHITDELLTIEQTKLYFIVGMLFYHDNDGTRIQT